MGCCNSKQTVHEEDDQTRLIDGDIEVNRYGTTDMVSVSHNEQSQVRELESLQKIVERTAESLIDIPSALQLERLQQKEVQNRSNEYVSALNTVKLPQQTIRKLSNMATVKTSSSDLPSLNDVIEAAAGTGGVNTGAGAGGKERSSTSSGNSIKAPSVREVLSEKTVDPRTVGWMANAMGELQHATDLIDVEDVGDLIVNLSPPV